MTTEELHERLRVSVVPRRSIAGDERLLWVELSRPAGRKRGPPGSHRRTPGGPCTKARRALGMCYWTPLPSSEREPCEALLASPFRQCLDVRWGWSLFPKDSSHGQTTR